MAAVTCKRCKATEVYQLALGAAVMGKKDDPLGVLRDPKGRDAASVADVARAYVEMNEEVLGSESWELPGFMKVDAVAALTALTLYEHLRADCVPAFDAMRSALASYLETL